MIETKFEEMKKKKRMDEKKPCNYKMKEEKRIKEETV